MTLSMYERQQWTEIEQDLSKDHRLTALARAHSVQDSGIKPASEQLSAWLLVMLLGAAGMALLAMGVFSGHTAGIISGVTLFALLVAPMVVMGVARIRRHRRQRVPREGP